MRQGGLRASRSSQHLAASSWMIADLVAKKYSAALPLYARGDLIDVGCGRVPLFAAYRELVSTTTCVDWPHTLHGVDHLDLECDISDSLPLPSGAFDTVILSDVLEHIPEPLGLMRELHRITRPGGHLIMNVPFFYWIHEAPHDYHRYTEYALRRLAQQSAFELISLEAVGGSVEVIADIVGKHLARVPILGESAARALGTVLSAAAGTSLGRRLIASTSTHFPLGYFAVARHV